MENRSNHILAKSPIPYASSDDNILVFILVCNTGYNGFHLSTSNDRRYWFLYLSAYPTQWYPVYLRPENTGCAKNEKSANLHLFLRPHVNKMHGSICSVVSDIFWRYLHILLSIVSVQYRIIWSKCIAREYIFMTKNLGLWPAWNILI